MGVMRAMAAALLALSEAIPADNLVHSLSHLEEELDALLPAQHERGLFPSAACAA